jgi:hypothetical protein
MHASVYNEENLEYVKIAGKPAEFRTVYLPDTNRQSQHFIKHSVRL